MIFSWFSKRKAWVERDESRVLTIYHSIAYCTCVGINVRSEDEYPVSRFSAVSPSSPVVVQSYIQLCTITYSTYVRGTGRIRRARQMSKTAMDRENSKNLQQHVLLYQHKISLLRRKHFIRTDGQAYSLFYNRREIGLPLFK